MNPVRWWCVLLLNITANIFVTAIFVKPWQTKATINARLEAGNVIVCEINLFADHYMLASDDTHVIHIKLDSQQEFANFVEEAFYDAAYRYSKCAIMLKASDVLAAVSNARRFVGTKVTYSLLDCNCEHWISLWATGTAFSRQVFGTVSYGHCETDAGSCNQSHTCASLYQHANYGGVHVININKINGCSNIPESWRVSITQRILLVCATGQSKSDTQFDPKPSTRFVTFVHEERHCTVDQNK